MQWSQAKAIFVMANPGLTPFPHAQIQGCSPQLPPWGWNSQPVLFKLFLVAFPTGAVRRGPGGQPSVGATGRPAFSVRFIQIAEGIAVKIAGANVATLALVLCFLRLCA